MINTYKNLLLRLGLLNIDLMDAYIVSFAQPGPRDAPMHCFIRRDKKNSTFSLYLSLTQGE
jgi:hypothetical protein